VSADRAWVHGVGALVGAALLVSAGGERETAPIRASAQAALERSLTWLASHRPDATSALGNRVLDAWSWTLFARLHPEAGVRERAASEARARLERLGFPTNPDFVALTYWAVALRCRAAAGLETDGLRDALAQVDLVALLAAGSPTSAWWSAELLRHSGVSVDLPRRTRAIAVAAAEPAYAPSVRDAVAFYHELAAAADLGTRAIEGFSSDEIAFVRRVLPDLVAASRARGDTDAAAEALIAAALLDERRAPWFREGVDWILAQQRPDGAYVRAGMPRDPDPDELRHGVLVASWALLEALAGRSH
jgi:hypothetical protein